MKRSSTAPTGPIQFKGTRTPTKEIIAKLTAVRKNLNDKKRKASEAFHQMDTEQTGRLTWDLKWRAQHGDKDAEKFLKVKP